MVTHFKGVTSNLLESIAEVAVLLFTMYVVRRKLKCSTSGRLFTLALSFGGLFFANKIMSMFISLLTQPSMSPEINSFDQFDRTSLRIAVPNYRFDTYVLEVAALKGKNWTNRVEQVYNYDRFIHQIYSFNTSQSYVFSHSRCGVLFDRQKQLSLRGYHIPKEYFEVTISAYLLRPRAPFKDRMNE